MPDLKSAIMVVEIIAVLAVSMVVGNYLGYKVGRWKLTAITGGVVLVTVVAFTIYAAVVLPTRGA